MPKENDKKEKILEGNVWSKFELSKLYGLMALILLSFGRILAFKYGETVFIVAHLMFANIGMQIHHTITKSILVVIS